MGTEEYDTGEAEKQRHSRAQSGANTINDKKRHSEGRTTPQLCVARTPSWYTAEERRALKSHYEGKPDGMQRDHIVPFFPSGGTIVGIHTLANLQYLTGRKNRLKFNRLEGDPTEHVRLGRAVRRRDINPDGSVNWQHHVRDRLAPIWFAIAKEFGGEPFTFADIAKRRMKTIPVRGIKTTTDWLNGNVGLLSGGYRLVVAAGLDGVIAWRLTTE